MDRIVDAEQQTQIKALEAEVRRLTRIVEVLGMALAFTIGGLLKTAIVDHIGMLPTPTLSASPSGAP